MKELSLHILDILQNSITAKADLVELILIEQPEDDFLEFSIIDNGCGMDEQMVKKVIDPFTTGRTTRKVGLGIPLLKLAAENTGGGIDISSEVGKGTKITARFGYYHIDRAPLGDMVQTMLQVITSYEETTDFLYTHTVGKREFTLDTREIKKILQGVPLKTPHVTQWLFEYLKEGEAELLK